MSRPIALCRLGDVEPLMSILPMLESAGYQCVLANNQLNAALRDIGCRNVDNIEDMQRRWGAEPAPNIPQVGVEAMDRCALYIDVNGNHNGPKIRAKWPRLKDRVLTYFINGGEPRLTDDKGDCQTPTTPMMTTAQHYRSTLFCPNLHWNKEAFSCDDPPNPRGYWTNHSLSHPTQWEGKWYCPHGCGLHGHPGDSLKRAPWLGKVYTFYPMFTRWDRILPRAQGGYGPPVSFVHNSMSWGGQAWYPWAQPLGVKSYGGGNSPDGLIPHADCFRILSQALCTVYLKSGGAVDYSILEPMAAGCPTTFHTSYVHNCRLYDLLEDGVTCLMWDSPESMRACVEKLKQPAYNQEIAENARKRLDQVLWNDPRGFAEFMGRWFK